VQAPATTGHPDFERAFRAHQNTIEATVMFPADLWIASVLRRRRIAAWLGWAWLVGSVWYLFAYCSPAASAARLHDRGLANLGLLGDRLLGPAAAAGAHRLRPRAAQAFYMRTCHKSPPAGLAAGPGSAKLACPRRRPRKSLPMPVRSSARDRR
jgi:hypothetical protein